MNRQLYQNGTGIESLDIPMSERILLSEVLEPESRDYINDEIMSKEDEDVMQRLMELQKRPEYQYNEENPYQGPRDMRMTGGITNAPIVNNRVNAFGGFGGFVGDILGGAADVVGDVVGGAADVVGDIASSATDIIDPVAQVLAVVPNPYQPYAQAYTGVRSSGIGGDYGGFQIGGFTPGAYGGQYGMNPFSSPSFAPGPGQAPGSDFGISNLLQFAPMGKETKDTPRGPTGPTGPTSGDILTDIGIRVGTNLVKSYAQKKQEERNIEEATNFLRGNMSPEQVERAVKLYGGAAVSAAMAALAYQSQKEQLEAYKKDREAFERRREAKRSEYARAERPEVKGRPITTADVVRRPAMMGGIMDTRKGYMMGSEVPVRENPEGIKELDYRQSGGFVPPIGIKEKADDIPAMLSNNEFVFTADAVRAAGGGSVNKGAQKMYALMKQLEGKA